MLPCTRIRRTSDESGSTLLIALVTLFVLTTIGLTLSLVTQTEIQLGDHERASKRVFYAAESGFSPAVSRALLQASYDSQTFSMPDLAAPPGWDLRQDIDVSPFFPILAVPCDLCQINNAGAYGVKQYFEVTHAVTVRADRLNGEPGEVGPVASKSVSLMVDLQPAEAPAEAHAALMNSAEIAKIRF